jgi:hypothetical protein
MMAHGRMSHHWDLFAPLICFTANPNLKGRYKLQINKIHPFRKKKLREISQDEFKNILYANRLENCNEQSKND